MKLQRVKSWLNRNKPVSQKPMKHKYTRAPTLRGVVAYYMARDVEEKTRELSGAAPGSQEYLKYYQPALTAVVNNLTEEKQTEYEETAEEWTKTGPPPEVQQANFGRSGEVAARQFATEMFRQMGVRVFILGGFKNADGAPTVWECVDSHVHVPPADSVTQV